MKSFMSAALQETKTPETKNGATECNSCDGGVVRTTGQESTVAAPGTPEAAKTPVPQGANAVVVMQGPLGTAITEALNKSLSKKVMTASVQVPAAATESLSTEYVQANGQINNVPVFLSKISKAVGLVPATDDKSTAVNTLLDCASKVDDIEFIMVGKIEEDPSAPQVPQKSILHIVNVDGTPTSGKIAIESIQVIVNYRKIKG